MARLTLVWVFVSAFVFVSNAQSRNDCPVNSDRLYDRKKVIKKLGGILNKSIPENTWSKYGVAKNGTAPAGFFIYDLTDTANKVLNSRDCIQFKNGHIYHFAPFDFAFSLSHIVILEGGKLRVFKSINCRDRGDSLEDVIAYLKRRLANDENKDEILERVRNYKEYSKHFVMDNYSTLVCSEETPQKQ